jgi:hypothetical protein
MVYFEVFHSANDAFDFSFINWAGLALFDRAEGAVPSAHIP